MKNLLLVLLAALPLFISAQAPDLEAIREKVSQKGTEYYYPDLFSRYILGDSTLTADHYRHIYYGFVDQLQYQPFRLPDAGEEMYLFSQKKDPGEADFRALINYLTGLMIREPFNMPNLNLLTYAYNQIGDKENELKSARRLNMLVSTIYSSGNGVKEKSPWHVIYMDNITDIMTILDQPYEKKPIMVSIESLYMKLLQKSDGIKGYYFNFASVYLRPPDPLDNKNRGWEFNGIRIK